MSKRILEMWMACHTQEEIAEACGCDQAEVSRAAADFMKTVPENQNHKTAASHLSDLDIPLYNVWKQQEKTR